MHSEDFGDVLHPFVMDTPLQVDRIERPREVARWSAHRDQGREQARLGVSEPEEHACSSGDPDPDHRASTQFSDYDSDILGVVFDVVGSRQRIGRARAARIDRNDPKLLAELFQDGLDRGQSIGERADQQQRDLATPMLVERDPRPAAE